MYTDQQQPRPTNKQIVPNEVTCNPTDDTKHDDELSNSCASNHCDYPFGAYYFLNQTGQLHHANQSHQMKHGLQMHPMMPSITQNALMDCQNCQMYLPFSQVNESCNQQNYQSSQRDSAEQMKHLPMKPFIKCKTVNDSTNNAISRLYEGSLPSWDPNNIMAANADRNNEASCCVSQYTCLIFNILTNMTNKLSSIWSIVIKRNTPSQHLLITATTITHCTR